MTEETPEKKAADADAQGDQRVLARRRGLIALVVTALVGVGAFLYFRGTVDLPGTRDCKVSSECQGMIGVECLHAPTGNYCTHTCNRDEDCDSSFHCGSPPWETGSTRLVCLRGVPPAQQ